MKRLVTIVATAAVLTACTAGGASAEFLFGVHQYSFHNNPLPSEQALGAYFGAFASERFAFTFSVDYYRLGVEIKPQDDTIYDEEDISLGSLTLRGGMKLYFNTPEERNVAPYFTAELFKGFGSASYGIGSVTVDLDPIKDLLSPFGAMLAFGSEYFVSDNFSIGGLVGIRHVMTSADEDSEFSQIDPVGLGLGEDEVSLRSTTIYSGIGVNFQL